MSHSRVVLGKREQAPCCPRVGAGSMPLHGRAERRDASNDPAIAGHADARQLVAIVVLIIEIGVDHGAKS